jgi:uncharacterized protein (TIGR02646 family)
LIQVQRTPEPSVLRNNATLWLSELKKLKSNPNSTQSAIKKAQDKYNKKEVKDALIKMFNGKCAYCESKITTVAYGEIEHFFPKSLYPDLTFVWKNLLLACSICNNAAHKGTKFPLDDQGNPLLIDPTDGITDPNSYLEFVWDDVAKLASVYGRDERGITVENIFDLNGKRRRRQLMNHRSEYVRKLFALLTLAKKGDQEALSLLEKACQPKEEYSAFAIIYILPQILNLLKPV